MRPSAGPESTMQASKLKSLTGRMASYELFAVLALGLIVLARPQWGVVALGLLALVWVVRRLGSGRWSTHTALDWCILGLVLALPASLYISADLALSLGQVARLLMGVALFYAVVNSAAQGWRFAIVLAIIVAGGAGLALLGLLGATHSGSQVLGLPQQLFNLGLPFRIHANVLATALVLILPLAAALALWPVPAEWPGGSRLVIGAAALLMLLALALTQSRGAYAGLLAAGLLMLAMRWRWGRWIALASVLLAGALLALTGRDSGNVAVAGILGREEVWLRSLYAIRDFPYSGLGFGLFDQLIPILYPYFVLGAGPLAQATHAHNLYLQIAADAGLLALVSFLAVLLAAAGLAAWLWRQGDEASRPVVWGLAGSLAALSVHGLVDAVAWSSKAAPLFWILLGVLAVQAQRQLPRLGES